MEIPATSILARSVVPIPTASARRGILLPRRNGFVPRSALGSYPMTAMHTASVQTAFLPARKTPGLITKPPGAPAPPRPGIGCPDPDRLGRAEHFVAAQERFRAALGKNMLR